jgi:hypothetical protein
MSALQRGRWAKVLAFTGDGFLLGRKGQQRKGDRFMMDFTNADRAKRAKAALKRYNGDNDPITNAVDFLTDLHHFYNLAHAQDDTHPTFDEALASARGHFQAEQEEVMKTYTILYAEDVPHYASVKIKAESDEDAIRLAKVYDFAGEAFEAERDNSVCKRIVRVEDETGNAIANDIPLDEYVLTAQSPTNRQPLPRC